MNRCLPLPVRAVPRAPGPTSPTRPQRWRPTRGHVAAVLSVAALALLSYLAGAAAMHFSLPSSDFLSKAFTGAQVWFASVGHLDTGSDQDRGPLAVDQAKVTVDQPGKTYDGFTL